MDKNLEYEPVRGAHILMIVNPVSGRIGGEHTADKLEAWLKENGAAVDRFETTETENGSGYTAKLAENDYARVVVLGGDGTLNAVLNGMLHRALRTPITYLPAGTTNDFAQTLGIQKHLLDPYKSFTETEDRLIDAGKFGDGYFSYVASFGLFTKCSYATPRTMKRLLGHFAYVLEGMKDLHALDATPLTVTADGKFFEGAYIFGAFSNSLSIGGMLKYDENSVDMNDGKLEMLLIRKPETLPDLHRLILALKNNDFSDKHIDFASASTFRLHAAAGFDWSIDGEYAAGGIDTATKRRPAKRGAAAYITPATPHGAMKTATSSMSAEQTMSSSRPVTASGRSRSNPSSWSCRMCSNVPSPALRIPFAGRSSRHPSCSQRARRAQKR